MRVFESRDGEYFSADLDYASKDPRFAEGRNGIMYCVGLRVEATKYPGNTKKVTIYPLNKRGVGSCSIEIPADDLDQAIIALQTAKAFLQTVRQDHTADVQRLEA